NLVYPQTLPGTYGVDPLLPPTGIVGSFNNLGHWYGGGSGGLTNTYGHWYPNGIRSGSGILGNGLAGGGGSYGGVGTGGLRQGSAMGALGGAALGVGATLNQFRH